MSFWRSSPCRRTTRRRVVRRVVPDADDSLVQHVWEVSRGSPLAATELAHAAGTARGEVSLSRLWLHALPRTVLEALRAAAVLGTTFDTDEFVAVTVLPPPEGDGEALDEREAFTALERALRARVVVRTERGFAFRHALVRDAVLEGVAAHDLRELHRRAAEALQRLDGSPARIAHHLVQAGERAAAVPYVLRAAETEAALGAYGSALATLDSVLGQARGEHLARCLELRADCLMARADAGATSAYRDALAVQTDARSRSRLRARLARAAVFTGDLETAADALDGLELDGSDTDGDVLLARGNLAMFQGDLDAADAAAAEARRRLTEVSGNDWRLFDLVALQGFGRAQARPVVRAAAARAAQGPGAPRPRSRDLRLAPVRLAVPALRGNAVRRGDGARGRPSHHGPALGCAAGGRFRHGAAW